MSFSEDDLSRVSTLICYLQSLPPQSKTIVFANTIKCCRRMQFFVDSFAIPALNLHSHMQQKQRLKKLDRFKNSKDCNVLIATDVAARGLDFNISHVVQIGVPTNGDTYVHRAGRTARANRQGEAFIIVDRKEAKRWQEINDIINETSPSRRVEKFNTDTSGFQETRQQVEKLEWIRRNEEKVVSQAAQMHDEEDAEQLGVGVEEEAPRKKYDLDREEEQVVRQQVKRKVESIRSEQKRSAKREGSAVKNRLMLSL